jgi:hypothetical protein
MTPVPLTEPSPMARARRGNDGTRRRHKRGISRVTTAVTWGVAKAVTCAAAPVEQRACRRQRFGLELRPPVTEHLQRQALPLAILPLIQVTPLPRFMAKCVFPERSREYPVPSNQFPVRQKIFPVRSCREFNQKAQSLQVVRATHQSRKRPESRKFPVFSLDNRESQVENSSLVTAPTASLHGA